MYRRDTTPFSIGFYQTRYWNTACAFAFSENESRFQEAKHAYIREFYESTGLTEANFLRPLAKLCVRDAGRTPKKITAISIYLSIYLSTYLSIIFIHPSVHPVRPSIHPSVHLPRHHWIHSVHCIYPSMYLSIYRSIYLIIYHSIIDSFIHSVSP